MVRSSLPLVALAQTAGGTSGRSSGLQTPHAKAIVTGRAPQAKPRAAAIVGVGATNVDFPSRGSILTRCREWSAVLYYLTATLQDANPAAMMDRKTAMVLAREDSMGVNATTYKETLAHWATGVTVVTSLALGKPVGITANSFTSLSLDPPQVLISVNKRLFTHAAIRASGVFAASILRAADEELGKRFAGLIPEVEDRFAGLETFSASTGCPILADALAWVDCEVRHAYDGVDHTIFVGEVVAAGADHSGSPLIYYNRKWRTLE